MQDFQDDNEAEYLVSEEAMRRANDSFIQTSWNEETMLDMLNIADDGS